MSEYNTLHAADMQLCFHLTSSDRSEQGSSDRSQLARSDHYTIYNPAAGRMDLEMEELVKQDFQDAEHPLKEENILYIPSYRGGS